MVDVGPTKVARLGRRICAADAPGIAVAHPLAVPLLFLMAGAWLGGSFCLFVSPVIILPALFASCISIRFSSRFIFILAISIVFFARGNLEIRSLLQPELGENDISRLVSHEQKIVEGVVLSRPEATETGGRLFLECNFGGPFGKVGPVTGNLLLSSGEGRFACRRGDLVRVSVRLNRPRNYGIPGEYDRERALALRGVYTTAYLARADQLLLVRSGEESMLRRFDRLAERWGLFISSRLQPVEAGILRALLLGDRGVVPRDLEDAYARAGVNHILSISGFHVGIVAVVIVWFVIAASRLSCRIMLRWNVRHLALVLAFPFILFYAVLAGAAPATLRSVLMIGAFMIARLLQRETSPFDSLILAALVILGACPADFFDLSFQLSFLAMWGILLIAPPESETAQTARSRRLYHFIVITLAASAAATAATLLPVAYHFHRATLAGLVSNLIVVPLVGYGAVVLGFVALPFIGFLPSIAGLLVDCAAVFVRAGDACIRILARIPHLATLAPDGVDLFLSFTVMLVLTFVSAARTKYVVSALLVGVLAGHMAAGHWRVDRALRLYFLSVGQGEATLIHFSDGRHMLVDGGGTFQGSGFDVGDRIVVPALRALGVKQLDYVVLTHAHPDHLQGLKAVIEQFPVGEFIFGPGTWETEESARLYGLLARREVPLKILNAATGPIGIGPARLEPLWPPAGAAGSDDFPDKNDLSLVFRVVAGETSILFTGDISAKVEEVLVQNPSRLACTVLKVPHHGSRYSSSPDFIRAASPQIAVISAGFNNRFRLPAAETLAVLHSAGVRLLRTDLDGTIEVSVQSDAPGLHLDTVGARHLD